MVMLRQISSIMVSGIQLATAWLFVAAVLLRLWKKKPGRDVLLPIAFVPVRIPAVDRWQQQLGD